MASYHSNFTYLNKNSADEGFIVASFEPDDGFVDTFLGMEQVSEESSDGTRKFLYGNKYNNKASILITIIKADGTDMSEADNRRALRWLTGARTASWLDLYNGTSFRYSFLGNVTESQQRKLDGRIIGLQFTFSSLAPWAYSAPQEFYRPIAQELFVDDEGILMTAKLDENGVVIQGILDNISVGDDGTLYNGPIPGQGADFLIEEDGTLYVGEDIVATFDNETDDLYSYIYLDVEFFNETCGWLQIINQTLNEQTEVKNIGAGNKIYISGKQFILEYKLNQLTNQFENANRTFGDDFTFNVWPRLKPGENKLIIKGDGNGTVKFTYRYPMKVGDCAMDISTYGGGAACGDGNAMPSYNTVRWEDIADTPTTIGGYGITDAYTKTEVDTEIDNIDVTEELSIDEAALNNMLSNILG